MAKKIYATGSSYLIRQTAGSERYGGLTVRISPQTESVGTLKIEPTDWRTGKAIEDDINYLISASVDGLNCFAAENAIDLSNWDITICRFAYHPVDSGSRTVQIAAYNAMASAIASWYSMYVRPYELQQDKETS